MFLCFKKHKRSGSQKTLLRLEFIGLSIKLPVLTKGFAVAARKQAMHAVRIVMFVWVLVHAVVSNVVREFLKQNYETIGYYIL